MNGPATMRRWNSVYTARRACLVLGALIAVFGAAQLVAVAVLSTLASAWANAIAAEGFPAHLPECTLFGLVLRLGLASSSEPGASSCTGSNAR